MVVQAPSNPTSRVEVVLQPPPSAHSNAWIERAPLFAWPVAAVLIVLVLRRAIADALKGFGARATKLSVGVVAVELAAASARSWGGAPLDEIRDTAVTAPVGDSSVALVASLGDDSQADYAVVDVGGGSEWLTSRLYMVASLVARMRRIRAVVFVSSMCAQSTLVGVVDVVKLRWALASHFPWLELAFLEACSKTYSGVSTQAVERNLVSFAADGKFESWRAAEILKNYKAILQHRQPVPPVGTGWQELGAGVWERAEWVTPENLFVLLGPALMQTAVVRDLDTTEEQFAKRILRATQDFVPVVDDQRAFRASSTEAPSLTEAQNCWPTIANRLSTTSQHRNLRIRFLVVFRGVQAIILNFALSVERTEAVPTVRFEAPDR
jgi:hypothetical protein